MSTKIFNYEFEKGKTVTPWIEATNNYCQINMLYQHNHGARIILKSKNENDNEFVLCDTNIDGFGSFSKIFYVDFKYIQLIYINTSLSKQKVQLNIEFNRTPKETLFPDCLSRSMNFTLDDDANNKFIKGCGRLLNSIHIKNLTKNEVSIIGYDTQGINPINKVFEFYLNKNEVQFWNPHFHFVNGLQIVAQSIKKQDDDKKKKEDGFSVLINISFC